MLEDFKVTDSTFINIYLSPLILLGILVTPFFDWQDRRHEKKFRKYLKENPVRWGS